MDAVDAWALSLPRGRLQTVLVMVVLALCLISPIITGFLTSWVIFGWVPYLYGQRALLISARQADATQIGEIVRLRDDILTYRRKVASLQQALVEARTVEGARPGSSESDALFNFVGLSSSAPNFLVVAARRSYQRELHPDRKPPAEKAASEKRLQEVEACFHEIFRKRRLGKV